MIEFDPFQAGQEIEMLLSSLGIIEVVQSHDDPHSAYLAVEKLEQIRRSVTYLIELYRENLAKVIEVQGGEVDLGQVVLSVRTKWRERYDKALIARRIATLSRYDFDPETGEILREVDDPDEVRRRMESLFAEIWLSPASAPKKTKLVSVLGLETARAALSERTAVGREVKVRAK